MRVSIKDLVSREIKEEDIIYINHERSIVNFLKNNNHEYYPINISFL